MNTTELRRKDEIRDAIVDYVFEHGVSDLSLRPLAEHLGTSARMLLYHFETKEKLLVEVIAAARARQYESLAQWREQGATTAGLIRRYWQWAAMDSSRAYIRLFFEVYGLALQGRPGTEEYLPALVDQAVTFFASAAPSTGLPPEEVAMLIRLAIAVLRGLLFDLLATNDRPLLDEALERFLAYFESQLSQAEE
jgi:AcrR family transcriptional regulator